MPIQPCRIVTCLLGAGLLLAATGCGDEPAYETPATSDASKAPAVDTPTASDDASASDLVALKITLPQQLTIGTKPERIDSDADFDAPPPPPLQAPAAATNLALEKNVTSSDPMPFNGELTYLTDGDAEAYPNNIVELAPGVQWVQIDLEQPCDIYGIITWRNHDKAVVYRDVIVQIADNADFTENVRTLFNNDQDNSSGLGAGNDHEFFEKNHGHVVQTDGQTARYVRIYSNGSTDNEQNYYCEVAVYGIPH